MSLRRVYAAFRSVRVPDVVFELRFGLADLAFPRVAKKEEGAKCGNRVAQAWRESSDY